MFWKKDYHATTYIDHEKNSNRRDTKPRSALEIMLVILNGKSKVHFTFTLRVTIKS